MLIRADAELERTRRLKKSIVVLLAALCACSSTQHSNRGGQVGALAVNVAWIKDRSRQSGPDYIHAKVELHNTGQGKITLERDRWLTLVCAGKQGYLVPSSSMPGWTLEPGMRREGVFIFRMEDKLPFEETWPVRIAVKSTQNGRPMPDCVIDLDLKSLTYWPRMNKQKERWRH